MNWGTKILILYLAFVGLIVTLVVTCLNNDTELEYSDYYAREIKFQDQIDANKNALSLATPIDYEVKVEGVEIKLPAEIISGSPTGSIHFMRPSDSKLDKMVPLNTSADGKQLIAAAGFEKGLYKMKILISSGGKNYFKESIITFK